MKSKHFNLKRVLIWACAIFIALTPFYALAESGIDMAIEGYAVLAGDETISEWIENTLPDDAGGQADNYILGLYHAQSFLANDFDFGNYRDALYRVLMRDEFNSPVSKQRSALTLIALGSGGALPDTLADETIGKLGIMSYIFGLHLIHNGAASDAWSEDMLVEKIISLQKQDGGWAITGNYGDVDVTAMCIQALAGRNYGSEVDGVIGSAIDFLAEKQLESAGYSAYGVENCESCAQVLIALKCAGIDYAHDERFIKNGRTILDALLDFRTDDGLFEHNMGGGFNEMATAQALAALVALNTDESIYNFSSSETVEVFSSTESAIGIRLYILIAIAIFAILGTVYAFTRKRGKIIRFVLILFVAVAAATVVMTINVQSAENYYGGEARTLAHIDGYVTVSIDCSTVAGMSDNGSTPDDGIILSETTFPFQNGDSVFDLLTDAVRKAGIQMEYTGASKSMAYVKGINNLYEYDYGELSGWMYCVNGEFLSVGCGSYAVQDGDKICWRYTTELGEDFK